ncbi:MAG: GNAT family N-acetyltransferase [Chloroflexi bacterium]|nr:GNAT family N-acetyltransferase [Chloroflexota bacterium]
MSALSSHSMHWPWVRRLRIGEAELYRQVRLAALRESPAAFSTTYESARQRSLESWREQADSTAQGRDRATFIAFCGEAPIGLAALYRTAADPNVGELLQVWVSPPHRGRGVALALTDALLQWARASGFRTALAAVAQGNSRALRLYRRCGFTSASAPSPGAPVILAKDVEDAPPEGDSGCRRCRSMG